MKYFLLISEYNKAVVAAKTEETAEQIANFLFMEEDVEMIELNTDAFQSEGVIMTTNEDNIPCDENCGKCDQAFCSCHGCELSCEESFPECRGNQ